MIIEKNFKILLILLKLKKIHQGFQITLIKFIIFRSPNIPLEKWNKQIAFNLYKEPFNIKAAVIFKWETGYAASLFGNECRRKQGKRYKSLKLFGV